MVFDIIFFQTDGQQAPAFDPPQRVAGKYQGDAQGVGHVQCHIARVSIMPVDYVGRLVVLAQVSQGVVGKIIEMIPQLFLADISFRAGIDTYNVSFLAELFRAHRITGAHLVIDDTASEQVNPGDIGLCGQCSGEFDHVFGLSSGIAIPAEFQIGTAYQSMDTD